MNTSIAYLIIRAALGLNIFLHGFVRIRAGRNNFKHALVAEFADSIIGEKAVGLFALALPIVETGIGLLLLAGWLTQYAVIAGALVMLLLIAGKALKSDWSTVTFQMIYVAFYASLEMLLQYNVYALDQLIIL